MRINRTKRHSARAGSALVIVLIVVVMLSLGAYTFFDTMLLERRAADFSARMMQSRALADSGIEFAAATLGQPADVETENLYHDPTAYAGVTLIDSSNDSWRGRFTLIAPLENDSTSKKVRYGLIDESSKINLNAIEALGLDEIDAHLLLMSIPGMTDEAADGLLDWVDTDDDERTYGAESITYESLGYSAKNARCESIDELLLVYGVTPELLYGEDTNRNGLIDSNEKDGEVTAPTDNEDDILDLGWSAYLTVHALESNLKSDGAERIDLNQPLLTELYDELALDYGVEVATFITAFRMNGPVVPSVVSGTTGVSTGDAETDDVLEAVAEGLTQQLFRVASGSGGTDGQGNDQGGVTRGGMDLSGGAQVPIVSLYELVDAEVTVEIEGNKVTLASPWSSSGGGLAEDLPLLLEEMSTTSAATIDGRINVNQARREVLLGIPGMPVDLPDQIAAHQLIDDDGQPLTDLLGQRSTTAWLLLEDLVDLPTMQVLDKYVCARGDVFSVQSVGGFDRGGAVTRVEAVIDATQKPPQVKFRRDLTRLGPGYKAELLIPTETTAE